MVATSHALSKVHPDWLSLLDFNSAIEILSKLNEPMAPNTDAVFRVFESSPDEVKVLILGQDPYPTAGDAMGLAFSIDRDGQLPKSLQNIFKELQSDLGGDLRTNGNLSDWQAQGVFLLNRVLTAPIGSANGHANIGWENFTLDAIKELARRKVPALLMGRSAEQVADLFEKKMITPHPSPLSAYRGFFGSKPFSKINSYLETPIKW